MSAVAFYGYGFICSGKKTEWSADAACDELNDKIQYTIEKKAECCFVTKQAFSIETPNTWYVPEQDEIIEGEKFEEEFKVLTSHFDNVALLKGLFIHEW